MGVKENDKIVLDTALNRLGRFGKWQSLIYHAWGASSLIAGCIQLIIPVFIAYAPPYHCNVPSPGIIPPNEKCKQYENFTTDLNVTSKIIPCQTDILFYTNTSRTSIVTEFSLVCSRENLAELTMTLFVVGGMVGANIFSVLADKYGRRPVHLVSHILMALVSGFTALSNGIVMYSILRFLTGFIQNGIIVTGTLAACEVYPAKYRAFGGIFVQLWWSFAMFLIDMLAYLIRDWRMLQLVLSLIPSVFIIAVYFYPETTPWLVANGKIEVAEELLRKGEKWSGKKMFPEKGSFIKYEAAVECRKHGKEKSSLSVIMSNRTLVKNLVIQIFLWFANVLIYWGISYMSTMLSSNLYLSFFYNAIFEVPAVFICLFLLPRFGRRLPLFIYHAVAGILLIIVNFIPTVASNGANLEPLKVVLTMLAKFAITASFCTIILYTSELFPTNARNTGLGMTYFAARIAGVIAPFALSVARIIPWLPGVIFGIIALLAAILGLFLPETQNRPLPETAEEIEEWHRGFKFYQFKVPKSVKKSLDSEYKNNTTKDTDSEDSFQPLKETVI